MRIAEINDARSRMRTIIELPWAQPRLSAADAERFVQQYQVRKQESVKRRVLDAAAPRALRVMQPWIRSKLSTSLRVKYNLLSWGERFAKGAAEHELARLMRPYNPQAVLVEGCGYGDATFQYWLRKGLSRVYGVEISNQENVWPGVARKLEAAFGAEVCFRQGTIEQLPYEDESFDLIVSGAVYEHVYNLDAAAKESARVLKAGGFAFHGVGPLYFCYSGDHCITAYGFAAGYDHLLLSDSEYRSRVEDTGYFANLDDPLCYGWALANKFSFAKLPDYLQTFSNYFSVRFLLPVISPEGCAYRARFPDRWARLLDAGLTDEDLLVKGMWVILQKV
jgi:SAM-dependent methyltransferase